MSRSLARRVTVLLLLTAFVGAPWAAAQPVRHTSRIPQVVVFWNWLTGFLVKEGCSLDPDGALCPRLGSATQGSGCSLDPDGCAPVVLNLDNGCSLDPSGHCLK